MKFMQQALAVKTQKEREAQERQVGRKTAATAGDSLHGRRPASGTPGTALELAMRDFRAADESEGVDESRGPDAVAETAVIEEEVEPAVKTAAQREEEWTLPAHLVARSISHARQERKRRRGEASRATRKRRVVYDRVTGTALTADQDGHGHALAARLGQAGLGRHDTTGSDGDSADEAESAAQAAQTAQTDSRRFFGVQERKAKPTPSNLSPEDDERQDDEDIEASGLLRSKGVPRPASKRPRSKPSPRGGLATG